jgi:diguanylate cyclase (GGDEF)-like protein/PAS domain S-box-containing protein
MAATADAARVNVVKGLRLLEEVERDKGELYEVFGTATAAVPSVSAMFARLALDQTSRRNVISYQVRIVARNCSLFREVTLPTAPLSELVAAVASLHGHVHDHDTEKAIAGAIELETLTGRLYEDFFPASFSEHFGPVLASLRQGTSRHLELLARALAPGAGASREPDAANNPVDEPVAAPARERAPGPAEPAGGEQSLLDSIAHTWLFALLDSLHEGAYIVDAGRRIAYWNPAAEQITGFSKAEMVGRNCHHDGLNHVDGHGCRLCTADCPLLAAAQLGVTHAEEVFLHHKEGHRLPVTVRVFPVKAADGTIMGSAQVFRTKVEAEEVSKLEKLAYLDALSGVANRRYLEAVILSRLSELQRHGWKFGLMFLDVDNLRGVNNARGHHTGDQLLRMVASTLGANVRASDIVGRWGGDEFLIVVSNVDEESIRVTAEKLRMLVEQSSGMSDGTTLTATVSVGCTLARPEDTLETLLARSDELMYESKRTGGNRVTRDCLASEPENGGSRQRPAAQLRKLASRLLAFAGRQRARRAQRLAAVGP